MKINSLRYVLLYSTSLSFLFWFYLECASPGELLEIFGLVFLFVGLGVFSGLNPSRDNVRQIFVGWGCFLAELVASLGATLIVAIFVYVTDDNKFGGIVWWFAITIASGYFFALVAQKSCRRAR